MATVKHTKTELKKQRDMLRRFKRFLPNLQLKKQQLQVELQKLELEIASIRDREQTMQQDLEAWVELFSERLPFGEYTKVDEIKLEEGNIAGVTIPILEEVRFHTTHPDLFTSPPWVDDGMDALQQFTRTRIQWLILMRQQELLSEELRITSQRVNLFEKVKIPESQDNIRTIRIFLGDQQAAEVARAKIAKGIATEKARSA
jgi:V/A-type H+-transporting ATPase subunit D